MNFVPTAISRKVAEQGLLARKHSPTILFGAGVVSMVGSTVLACRATLKLDEVLTDLEHEKEKAHLVKNHVESEEYEGEQTYTDAELKKDLSIILIRGVGSIAKLYAPSVILGGVGIACLTKSHKILQDRNAALTAAYVAIDKAFQSYRERVIDRYGEELDRELRYGSEEVTVIDEETGKALETTRVVEGEHSGYARWFDEGNNNFHAPPLDEYNWTFLRQNQNWANDMLRARGHMFLNEVYSMLGMTHTSAGAIVGWIYERDNERGDNYIRFGCWDEEGNARDFFTNGNNGSILLDFNVDGPIWDLIDKRKEESS